MIRWPVDLPQRVLRAGYSEGLPDGRLRTKTDAGPGKVRLATGAAVRVVACQIKGDLDMKARVERFWREETRGGVLPFLIPHQTFDGAPLLTGSGAPLLTQGDVPILVAATWLVRFGDASAFTRPAVRHAFPFTLEVLP
jgi:hypothetical protein